MLPDHLLINRLAYDVSLERLSSIVKPFHLFFGHFSDKQVADPKFSYDFGCRDIIFSIRYILLIILAGLYCTDHRGES